MPSQSTLKRNLRILLICFILIGAYLYNIKFIQLGIKNLGENVLSLDRLTLGCYMALLAILTGIISIITGVLLDRRTNSSQQLFDIIILITVIQLLLTIFAMYIQHQIFLVIWIIICSFSLGCGIPFTFKLSYLIIPLEKRGFIMGIISGIIYFYANISRVPWTVSDLGLEMLILIGGGLVFILISRIFGGISWILGGNENENSIQRVNSNFHRKKIIPLGIALFMMFSIFFVDSFGFLRIIDNPILYEITWNGDLWTRFLLGCIHFGAGILAGILYHKFNGILVNLISFCLLICANIGFSFFSETMPLSQILLFAAIYCAAVSFYTVNNFALWLDLSSNKNIGKYSGIGIGVGGWISSFLSTSLVLGIKDMIEFSTHLRIVALVAASLNGILIILLIFKKKQKKTDLNQNNAN